MIFVHCFGCKRPMWANVGPFLEDGLGWDLESDWAITVLVHHEEIKEDKHGCTDGHILREELLRVLY